MSFSDRTPKDLSQNRIAEAIGRLKDSKVLDLTESNPTRCGFDYPKDLLQSLGRPQGLVYEPDPFGKMEARQAVAEYLKSKGQSVEPSRILLTASTSEAYSYLFKLLSNPGDSFLVPTPGYPLLDHLLRLESLEPIPFPLQVEPGWPVGLAQTWKAVQSGTKGLIVVNPHNPTGCFLGPDDQKELLNLCQKHEMAYISDEVFFDFSYSGQPPRENQSRGVLSFRLGGLSKSLGLPQLKLSWVVMDGPEKRLEECRERLELIADTYLSVNTSVQLALKDLFQFAPHFQRQVLERVLGNRAVLEKGLGAIPYVKIWQAQGGWYALLEVMQPGADDEKLVIDLLEKQRVLVQPGGFYDFPKGCFLVLSLLPQPDFFGEAVQGLIQHLNRL